MAGLNRVTLIGRLGKDPETKSFSNGGKIVTFSVATSETWNDKQSGERKERTEWHNVSIQNENAASVAERFLRKGSNVGIEGSLQTRKWQDKLGADRYTTEVVVGRFNGSLILIDKAEGGEQRSASLARAAQSDPFDELDDDIAF